MTVKPKRILVFSFGSRGDTQPLLALGARLHANGHSVTLVANKNNESFITSLGVACAPIRFDFEQFLNTSPVLRKSMATGDTEGLSKAIRAKILDTFDQEFRSMWSVASTLKPDLIITNMLDYYPAHALGTTLGVPVLLASLSVQGMLALTSQVTTELGEPFAHKAVAYLILKVLQTLVWSHMKPIVRTVLAEALPADTPLFADSFACLVHEHMKPIALNLVSSSTLVVPKPSDVPRAFVERTAFTGFWVVSKAEQEKRLIAGDTHWSDEDAPLDAIRAFLSASRAQGKPTAYLGWGSMIMKSAEHMTELAVRSLKLAGMRGIVLGGWAKLHAELLSVADHELRAYAKEHVLFLSSAPHEWLFPQVSVTIHHGGAGTTAAALRSGVPTIITPCIFDQFDNAALAHKCGAGHRMPHLKKVTASSLAAAMLRCTTDEAIQQRARELGAQLQQEDGLGNAVASIDAFIATDLDSGRWQTRFDAIMRRRSEQSVGGLGFTARVLFGDELIEQDADNERA